MISIASYIFDRNSYKYYKETSSFVQENQIFDKLKLK